MNERYDAIIIGAGHNGLVAAATLAAAGRRVLVLEQRDVLGGMAGTQEVWPDYRVDTGATDATLLQDEIIHRLDLAHHGLRFREQPALLFAPQPDGRGLTIWRDEARTQSEIARFSQRDSERWPAFRRQVARMTGLMSGMLLLSPPDLGALRGGDLMNWAPLALRLKRLGGDDMMELMRILPMAVRDYLDEWFESDALKGALAGSAVVGMTLGPRGAGTNLGFFYQNLGGLLQQRFVDGGMGMLAAALAAAASERGAVIRTGVAVERILVEGDLPPVVTGVALAGGEIVHAGVVLSNADPRRTLFGLVGPQHLEPETMRHVRNIIFRGSTARVNLAVSALPNFTGSDDPAQLTGRVRVCPSLDYLERAYDNAKYGRYSDHPYLEVVIPTLRDPSLAPAGQHILSINALYAPYALRDATWDECASAFGETVLDTLESVAPGVRATVVHRQVVTPLDLEREYGPTEGSIYHGQMGLEQMVIMRPIPGWSRYETPVRNLYLCGAGAHPGGGVTGAPGYNAARAVLAAG